MGRLQKKTWARVDDGSTGDSRPLDNERWLEHWAFGTARGPGGLGLSSVEFWGLTPREFQALAKVWEADREFQVSLCARIDATLRNTAIDVAFKPPSGKWWTPQMLMPGYSFEPKPEEYDWRTQRDLMNLVGKRPDPEKIREQTIAMRDTMGRFQMAQAAKLRRATSEEIRLILEA